MSTKEATNLTVKFLASLRPEKAAFRIPDGRCKGLAARVAPSGTITWDLAFRIKHGGFRRVSLGRYPEVSLEEARRRAVTLTEAARTGRDIVREEEAARVAERREVTVADLIATYIKMKRKAGLRTIVEIERRLLRALKPLLTWKAKDVRRRDIRELLDQVADSDRDREAEKRRQLVGNMFKWALARDVIDTDPAYGLPSYGSGPPRERTFDEAEIRSFLEWLPVSTLPKDHVTVLTLQLLTGARCGEIAGMRRSEIDTDTWVWTLPAARSKNKRLRRTPLVGQAREVVRAALASGRRDALFLAESGIALAATHVGQAIIHRRKQCPLEHWTSHDLRRTFASRMVDMGVSLELVAAIIGHEAGGRETKTLLRHYVRADQLERKAIALEAWDEMIRRIRAGEQSRSKVVTMQPHVA